MSRRPGAKKRDADASRSTADLVARARDPRASIHEQHAAFSALVARFEGMAYATALRVCNDHESARDACQDAFLTAWRMLSTLRDAPAFGGWIRRLVRTQCARGRRRRSATNEVAGTSNVESVADGSSDPSDAASRHELQDRVQRAVERLPGKDREAILLFYFLGEPLSGVARALGVSVSCAGKRIFDARLRLRRTLPRSVTASFLSAPAPRSFARLIESGMLDEFVGEYRFDKRPDHTLTIRREGDLLLGCGGGQRSILAGGEKDTLVPTEFDGEGRFRRDREGRVSHFVYYEFGRRLGVARKTAP